LITRKSGNNMNNPYVPLPVRIERTFLENEAKDIKTFTLAFERKEDEQAFAYLPGQFAQLSVPGKGESPIGIASSPTEKGILMFSIKRVGTVTGALHDAEEGDRMGVRGPLGKAFPWDRLEGKDVVIVGGGFAFTTLRSAIVYMLEPGNRGKFGKIAAVYGARTPGELLYKDDLKAWGTGGEMALHVTVDKAAPEWTGRVGMVPNVLKEVAPSPKNALALVCGPPIMIKYTLPVLDALGFKKEDVILSLEMRMKCGIGKCGRCNIGNKYVCTDGPVFTCEELKALPAEY
jgi:NAD(P)H-flavin reductase